MMLVKDILHNRTVWLPNEQREKYNPEVTIILPTYARAKSGFFSRAVQSVIKQSYTNWELIIVDDCSVDGTYDLIKEFMKKDGRISCVRHTENIGLPALSEYEGFFHARGKYIAFIFDDNEWFEDALEKTITLMDAQKLMATYGLGHLLYNYDGEERDLVIGKNAFNNQDTILHDNFIPNGAVVLHRSVIETVGMYDLNIALVRCCDYDLWRRIFDKYDFVETNIEFTVEHGAKLNDSLGNTRPLNSFAAEDIIETSRTECLKPENIMEYDVIPVSNGISICVKNAIIESLESIKNKTWIKEDYNRIKLEIEKAPVINKTNVLLLCQALTASEMFYFYGMQKLDNVVMKIMTDRNRMESFKSMCDVDVLILSRYIVGAEKLIAFAKKMGIKVIYFCDDNFYELIKEPDFKDNREWTKIVKKHNKKYFNQFDALFLSSQNLIDYYKKYELCDNAKFIGISPIIDSCDKCNVPLNKKSFNFLYLGGKFRNESFIDIVYPALQKVSSKYKVKLFVPEDMNVEKASNSNIEVVKFKRSLSLRTVLKRLSKYNINFLLHSGFNNNNMIYKTKNAILNAYFLNAVLVTSNIPPYSLGTKEGYAVAENTVEDWTNVILNLCDEDTYNKKIKENDLIVSERYNVDKAAKQFLEFLSGLTLASDRIEKRDVFLRSLLPDDSLDYNLLDELYDKYFLPYSIGDQKKIYFTGALDEGKYEFEFTGVDMKASIINLFFTSYDENVKGSVSFKLYYKQEKLGESEVNIEDITYNLPTSFEFPLVHLRKNNKYRIVINLKYKNSIGKIGTFKNQVNLSRWNKAVMKIRQKSMILNELYMTIE